jgi:RNA polymerase sigma factor (sigma-70 family)
MNSSGERYFNLHDELIENCKQGKTAAQLEIYKLYYKAMFNSALRIVNNRFDAEDIMQEAFLKAFQKIESYRAEVSFGAWLKRIVINQSLDFLRKKRIEYISIEESMEFDIADLSEEYTEFDNNQALEQVINQIQLLPEKYKIVLSLYLLEGYDHDEISEILNITSSTSRSQLLRAKRKLLENIKLEKKNEKFRTAY